MIWINNNNNFCIVPCPTQPTPPSNCLSGFSPYNSPTGCTSYVCNERLASLTASDDQAIQAALSVKRA